MSNNSLVRSPMSHTPGSRPAIVRGQYRSAGFSLIEVMVAVVVVAIGLLGIAAVQLKTLSTSSESLGLSISTIQANDFGERLWAAACVLAQNTAQRQTIATNIRNQWLSDHYPGFVTNNATTCTLINRDLQPICFVDPTTISNNPVTYVSPGTSHPKYVYEVRWTEKPASGGTQTARLLFYVSLPPDHVFEGLTCP